MNWTKLGTWVLGTRGTLVAVLLVTVVGWFLLASHAARHLESCNIEDHQEEDQQQEVGSSNSETDDRNKKTIRQIAAYEKATKWQKELLGLATTLAGFLGVTAGAMNSLTAGVSRTSDEPQAAAPRPQASTGSMSAMSTMSGTVGILAGMTILDVGEWMAPASLAVLVGGMTAIEALRARRSQP